ncbi:MICOS complex subunit Mic10 [Scaptodrosophila lebanonensis]|uniref:MICOS complex subunit MIC10 n=1 Tax=Drosophila lebanonensis TaxID=7225 RepID=A0A6J2T469_DROLE|nr:MICOS complex subunit Mic10 [Scaptodrosophila lebanonensis]
MSHAPQTKPPCQSEHSKINDKCIADVVMKGGSGILIGSVLTLCFTRPRTYPIWMGLGFGLGLAYDCCQARWNASTTKD